MAKFNTPETRRSIKGTYKISEDLVKERMKELFRDPIYNEHRDAIDDMSHLAWKAFKENHKSPFTQKAGHEFKDPNYDLSTDWCKTRAKLKEAQTAHDKAKKPHVLLVSASPRNDYTCPGEVSKSRRLVEIAEKELQDAGVEVRILDLSEQNSDFGKHIYPCKGCVSTAMPLCHWPCSCYPNHATLQVNDWMNDIYPMWVRAHAVMIVTPVHWYQAPSTLKLMIDRMVCADGGNTDPTTTKGKQAKLAKELELAGWDYPRHLEGRLFSVVVHGDAEGIDLLRTALTSWLKDIHMIPAGLSADLARYIGYYEPYSTSHETLDKDHALQMEVKNRARELARCAKAALEGKLEMLIPKTEDPRPK